MKVRIILLLLLAVNIFGLQKIKADVFPTTPKTPIDTASWVISLKLCNCGTPFSMAAVYTKGSASSPLFQSGSASNPIYQDFASCQTSQNPAVYYYTTLPLNQQPDSIHAFASNNGCGPVGPGNTLVGSFIFDDFNIKTLSDYYQTAQCRLLLRRTNHANFVKSGDYCGNGTFEFDTIIFFLSSEYLVIDAYIYSGLTFTKIGSYTVTPSGSTFPYPTSANILFSQFTSNYTNYLGQDIYFNWHYESTITNSPTSVTSKMYNVTVGYAIQNINYNLLSPLCAGQNGRLRINSISPISPVMLHYTIKPADGSANGISNQVNLSTLSFPYTISNVPLGNDSIIFYAQDFCMYGVEGNVSDVSAISYSTIVSDETCPGAKDGSVKISSSNYKLKTAELDRNYTLNTGGVDTFEFKHNTIYATLNIYINGYTAVGYPNGYADIVGPGYTLNNTPIGYSGSSNFVVPNANPGHWNITIKNGTNPSVCKWTVGYNRNGTNVENIYNLGANGTAVFAFDLTYAYEPLSILISTSAANGYADITGPSYSDIHHYVGYYQNSYFEISNAQPGKYYVRLYNVTSSSTWALGYRMNFSPLKNINEEIEFNGLKPYNNYNICVWNSNNCFVSDNFLIDQGIKPYIGTTTSVLPYCKDNPSGSITVNINSSNPGHTGSYLYQLLNTKDSVIKQSIRTANMSYPFTGLDTGSYKMKIIDVDNCISTAQSKKLASYSDNIGINPIGVSPNIIYKNDTFNLICTNGKTATLSTSAINPYGSVTYYWYDIKNKNLGSSSSINVSTAGKYYARLTDQHSCTVKDSVKVHAPTEQLIIKLDSSKHNGYEISCNGSKDGWIRAQGIGGIGRFKYSFDNNSSYGSSFINRNDTFLKSLLDTGKYTIYVKDTLGCETFGKVTIHQPSQINYTLKADTFIGGKNVSCYNANNGTVRVTISGGVTGDTLYLYDSISHKLRQKKYTISTGSFSGLPPDSTYYVGITDVNGCQPNASNIKYIRLTRPAPLAIDTVILSKYPDGSNIKCYNSNDGKITVKTRGGTFPHKIQVTGISYNVIRWIKKTSDSAEFKGLRAGNYYISLSDTNGCTIATVGRTLSQPAAALSDSIVTDHINGYNIRCHDMRGWARVIATGGSSGYRYKWADDQGNKIGDSLFIPGLYPDVTYRDSVFDVNGCSTSHTITLTDPELLQISNIDTIQPRCWYSDDGEILFSAINGVPIDFNRYLFKLENGATLMDSGTFASAHFYAGNGNYTLIVQDKNACTDTSYIVLHDRPALAVHLDTANTKIPSCAGGNDGVISLTGINGKLINGSNYIFNLHCNNTGYDSTITANTGVFDNLYAKAYEYTITDGFGCTDTNYFTLVDNAVMTISLVTGSMIPNVCYNDGIASLKVRADGGVGGYKFGYKYYNIDRGSDSIPADSLNCFTLHNLNWNEYNTKNLIWYIFYLRDKNYNPNQKACTVIDTFYLPKVYPIEFDTIKQDPLCFDSNNGKLGITGINGGTGGNYKDWTFSWSKEKSTITFPDTMIIVNLGEGIYNLSVTDSSYCTKIWPGIKLNNPSEFNIRKITTVPTECKTCSTGKVTYSSNSMGTANAYAYSIDNQSFIRVNSPILLKTFTGLSRGKHSLRITTLNNGCLASDSFYIPVQPPVMDLKATLPAGIGVSNGSITLGISGGTGNYAIKRVDSKGKIIPDDLIYKLVDSLTEKVYKITNLSPGIYSLVAFDDDSCSNIITDTINKTNQLTIDAYASAATCRASADGELVVDVWGTNLPFKYKWTNASGVFISDSARVVNTLPGKYYVEVTDSAGTTVRETIIVDSLPQLKIEDVGISEPTCFGSSDGNIGISVEGGSEHYSMTWSTGSKGSMLMDVPAGEYMVIVKDNNNSACNLTRKFHLSQPGKLSTLKLTINTPVCFGGNDGSIDITMKGGTKGYYLDGMYMNGDSAKITNLQAGNTRLYITDSRNCPFDSMVNVSNPLQIAIDKVGIKLVSCFGVYDGKLRPYIINADQPLVQWTDFKPSLYADSLSGLHPGTYNVLITDANGCKFKDTIILDETPKFVFDHFDYTEPSCFNKYDGSIRTYVSGGTMPVRNYSWSNGSKTNSAVNLSRGDYSITVYDHNYCKITENVTLSSPPNLTLNIKAKQPFCFGNSNGQISLSAIGGTGSYSFGCSNGSTGSLITGLSDNTYTLYVTDENGCETRKNYRLGQPEPLNPIYSIINSLKCNSDCNGAIDLSATGGTRPYSVLWPDNNASFKRANLCSGTYNVKFTDANDCYSYKLVPLSQPDPLTLAISSTVLPTCYGGCNGALHLSANGGIGPYLITWKNGQSGSIANNICAGSYIAEVTDSNNCKYAATFILPDPVKEEISGIRDNIRLCDGQVLTLNPGDWASCEWLENGTVISNDSKYDVKKAGTYTLNVISSKGCTDTKTFTVEYVKDLLKARFLLSGDAVAGEEVEIIDISWPVPDSINWIYNTDSVALLSNKTDRQNVIFKYPGVYLVRLVARTAQCVDEDDQYITIYATKDEYDKGKRPVSPEDDITEIFLYPNPNKGTFTIELTLKEEQKIILDIYKAVEGTAVYEKVLDDSDYYKEEINLSGEIQGVYSLVLTTSKQRKYFLFVIM